MSGEGILLLLFRMNINNKKRDYPGVWLRMKEMVRMLRRVRSCIFW